MSSSHDFRPPTVEVLLSQADWLRRLARGLTREPAAAEDVLQETWERALRRPPREAATARAWLGRVAHNVWVSGRRRARRRPELPLEAATDVAAGETPEELLARVQLHELVARLLAGLAEPYRQTVLLRYVEGISSAEIARRLGLPEGTVRWRLKAALDELRAALDERHGGERERWRRLLAPLAAGGPALEARPDAGRGTTGGGPARQRRTSRGERRAPALRPPTAGGRARFGAAALGAAAVVALTGLAIIAARPAGEQASARGASGRAAAPRRGFVGGGGAPAARIASGAIEGRVLDARGVGISGAHVTAYPLPDPAAGRFFVGVSGAADTAVSATSGPDGVYRIDVPPGRYALGAAAGPRGWAPAVQVSAPAAGGAPARADLRLVGEAPLLTGRVLDAGGGPIADARILLWGPEPEPRGGLLLLEARSDERGAFACPSPSESPTIVVMAGGYARHVQVLERGAAAQGPLELRLLPEARISGRVVAGALGGGPVAGAEVTILAIDGGPRSAVRPRSVRTDAEGRYHMAALAPGRYRVSARAETQAARLASALSLTAGGQAEAPDLVLTEGATLHGQVVSEGGAPIPRAIVDVREDASGDGFGSMAGAPTAATALTSRDGRFEIPGLLPGRYLVRASAPGFPSGLRYHELSMGAAGPLVVALSSRLPLEGQVLGADGRPAGGAAVIVEARLVLPGGRATSTAVLATADHVGRFSLRALGPGAISLVARRGDEAGRLGPVDRGPRGDEDARGLVVRLERGARIVGRIQWASGRPAAGMEVVAVVLGPGGATNDLRATTDREGGYALGPLPPGRIAVVAHPAPSSPSYTSFERPEQRALELGAGEVRRGVDLVLPDGSTTLAGRVLGPDGASVAGATVRIMTERGSGSPLGHVETTVTDLEGRFVARGLAPEPHRVEVSHPDFADRRTGGLHPGEEPTLRLARRSAAVGTTAP